MESDSADIRYCADCGSLIEPGATFCYACGANYREPVLRQNQFQPYGEPDDGQTYGPYSAGSFVPPSLEAVALSISKMISIWVVLAIAIGVISIVLAPYTFNFFRDVYGLTVTVPEIVREGMFLVVSGIAALVSSVLLKMTKMFWVCLICCVVAALTS